MLKSKQQDFLFALSAILVFSIVVVLVPIYDTQNGLHNIFFDNYKIVWADGRSPSNFAIIKNIINGKDISFPPDFVFRDVAAKDNYDFFENNGKYYPLFNYRPVVLFSIILKPFSFGSDLILYKSILFLVLVFFAATLFIFYFIQKKLGLKPVTAFFSTLTAGLATSIFIYSHYFFLTEVLTVFLFFIFLFFVLKYWRKNSNIASYLIPLSFSIFLFFFIASTSLFLLFLVMLLYFLYFKNRTFSSLKIFLIISFSIFIFSFFLVSFEFKINIFTSSGFSEFSIFQIFPNYLNADDYAIYGYHNVSSLKDRTFSYIYGFEQNPGNAIFIHTVGFFGTLFSEKGFIYNSSFLIFSFFGALYYKEKQKRNFLLTFIILYIFLLSANFVWYGGVIPRYVMKLISIIFI